jgi:hypothetical protein
MARPVKYETPEEMQKLIDLYFLACKFKQTEDPSMLDGLTQDELTTVSDIDDTYPTVSGLAYTLNLTRQGLIEYGNKDKFSVTVKKAKQRIEASLEQRLFSHAPAGTIFNLKNNFGWKDKTEQEVSGPNGGPQEHTWEVKVIDAKPTDT